MAEVIGRSWRMSQSLRAGVLAGLALVALLSAGCGDDAATVAQESTSAVPAATTPAAVPTTTTTTPASGTTPAPSTAESGTGTETAPTATTGQPTGETVEGGAGDEEAIRVPAAFRVRADGTVTPEQITVPAFLPVEITITVAGADRRVTVQAPGAGVFDVAGGGTARKRLAGLKAGEYAVVVQGGGRATLRVTPGGDAGP